MKRLGIAALIACCFAGCKVGPNYKRPEVVSPQDWRFAPTAAEATADTAWWEQFQEPVLNDLVQKALAQNKDIQVAAARVEQLLGELRTTRAGLFPHVNADGSAGDLRGTVNGSSHVKEPKPDLASALRNFGTVAGGGALPATTSPSAIPTVVVDNPASDFRGGLSASWQLDLWGQIRRSTEAARANVYATEEARRGVILTVVTTIANDYVTLRALDRQLDIARQTTSSREDAFKLFQLRYDAGVVSELELRQAESEFQEARATIPSIQKSIAQQEDAISVLLGNNPGQITRGKSLDELMLPPVPAALPSALLENRPDLRQAEQELIAANAEIGVARARYFPSISLTGALGLESEDLGNLFRGGSGVWSFASSLTAPIFSAGEIRGQVQAAEAVQQQTLLRYQQAIQGAFRDVENALSDQQFTREQLDAQRKDVVALQRYAYLARRRYDNGYTSYIEVLDAERSLFNAQLTVTRTQQALFSALVDVYNAIGGSWVQIAEKNANGPVYYAVPQKVQVGDNQGR